MSTNQNSQTARAAALITAQVVSAKTEQLLFSLELIDREDIHRLTPEHRAKKKADLIRELQCELVAVIAPQVVREVDSIYVEQRKEAKRRADNKTASAAIKRAKELVAG